MRTVDPATTVAAGGASGPSQMTCCVAALYNSPNIADVHGGPYPAIVVVVDEIIVGADTWYPDQHRPILP